MGVRISIVELSEAAVSRRILSDKAKTFANKTLYKLCNDFVPMDTGSLSRNVTITAEYVHYKSPYAHKVYVGEHVNFSKEKHRLATAYWDKAAMLSKKDDLVNSINAFIKRG